MEAQDNFCRNCATPAIEKSAHHPPPITPPAPRDQPSAERTIGAIQNALSHGRIYTVIFTNQRVVAMPKQAFGKAALAVGLTTGVTGVAVGVAAGLGAGAGGLGAVGAAFANTIAIRAWRKAGRGEATILQVSQVPALDRMPIKKGMATNYDIVRLVKIKTAKGLGPGTLKGATMLQIRTNVWRQWYVHLTTAELLDFIRETPLAPKVVQH